MRLGGPLFKEYKDPDSWISAVKTSGYRAAFCPVSAERTNDAEIDAYAKAAQSNDIVIAEVGAWSNPLSPDQTIRQEALERCKKGLLLADKIGANCCVNIAGSRGSKWDGPDEHDLTDDTFQMIVDTVREIIDSVQPARTYYTLETMPWMYPDSAESYLRLIRAIDRKMFAVHLDPTNLISSPQRYFRNGELIKECFTTLGPWIKSCHAKDILMSNHFMVHLDEVRPGCGHLDYGTFLRELNRLDSDVPLMLEHLPNEEEYRLGRDYIRSIAKQENIIL